MNPSSLLRIDEVGHLNSNAADYTPYHPERIGVPPLFAWPPQPRAALRWLLFDLMAPWGFFWMVLAVLVWQFMTPSLESMHNFSIGWFVQLWIRNAVILAAIAGSLHWWFHMHRGQERDTKFIAPWLATDDPKFLWRDQVLDNMTFSVVSGVTIWTCYEAATWWWYANGYVSTVSFAEQPVYCVLMIWGVFCWSTLHFYLNHRLLHFKPFYTIAHERHHRNVNTGPWSGISMHPLEHLIYFTVFLLWWVIPVHPVVIILTGLFQGVSPAVSHSGFDYLKVGNRLKIPTGDNFHNMHHRLFNVNYGNSIMPIDRLFNSWNGDPVPKRRNSAK